MGRRYQARRFAQRLTPLRTLAGIAGPTAKNALKRVRAVPALNVPATTVIRAALRTVRRDSAFAVEHLPRVGLVRCELPNGAVLRLRSAGDDWIPNRIFWRGVEGYEPEAVPVFLRLARDARVIVDVGAYIGLYSLAAALTNPKARVVAFEPLPPVYERLVANVAENRAVRVECVPSAVGERPGTAEFFRVAAPGLPSSSSLSFEFMSGYDSLVRSPVEVVTLDAFCDEHGIDGVDLIKVDTESTEPAVLRGMPKVLERDRPAILCEVLPGHGVEGDLEAILRPLGYSFYLLEARGPKRMESIVANPTWHNYLFTVGEPPR